MHAFVRSPGPPPPKFRWCERFVWVLFLCLSKRKHLIYYNLVTSPLRNKPFKASQVLSSNDHVLPQDIQMPLMLPLPPSSPPPPRKPYSSHAALPDRPSPACLAWLFCVSLLNHFYRPDLFHFLHALCLLLDPVSHSTVVKQNTAHCLSVYIMCSVWGH